MEVMNGDFKGHGIVCDDPVSHILDMGITSIGIFVLCGEKVVGTPRLYSSVLCTQSSMGPLPDWVDEGHPAYTELYRLLKGHLVEVDGIKGLMNPTHGLKFLKRLVKLL